MKIRIDAAAYKPLECDPESYLDVATIEELDDFLHEEIEAQDCLSVSIDDDDKQRLWTEIQALKEKAKNE